MNKDGKWKPVEQAINNSEELLDATLCGESDIVAQALETVHEECSSVLACNDENSLTCAIYIEELLQNYPEAGRQQRKSEVSLREKENMKLRMIEGNTPLYLIALF